MSVEIIRCPACGRPANVDALPPDDDGVQRRPSLRRIGLHSPTAFRGRCRASGELVDLDGIKAMR